LQHSWKWIVLLFAFGRVAVDAVCVVQMRVDGQLFSTKPFNIKYKIGSY